MSTHQKVARAAGLIAFLSIFSRILGFVRDQVMAAQFGTTGVTDAYVVAYTLPNLIYVVAGGALTAVFIPVFTGYLAGDEPRKGWRMAGIIFNITLLVMGLAALAGVIWAPFLVNLMAPGFKPETAALAADLARIMFPGVIFMGLAGICAGILNSFQRFALPAFAPAVTNLSIIAAAYFLAGKQGMGIYGVAIGALAGFLGQFLIQLPQVIRKGFRYSWIWDLGDPGVRKIGELVLPAMVGLGVSQLYVAIDRVLASGLSPGSIAALNFSFRLMQLPLGVFVMAISTAVFPTLAHQAARGEDEALRRTSTMGIVTVALLAFPAAVGLMALREPIVSLLFERGSFDRASTLATASALFFYAIGLFGHAGNAILTRVYYALKDTKTVVYTTLAAVSANLLLSLGLIRFMAHSGLALANSLAALINLGLLAYLLHRKLGGIIRKELLLSLGKVLAAAVLLGVASYLTALEMGALVDLTTLGGKAIQVGTAIMAGSGIYLGALALLKSEEAVQLLALVRKKIVKRGAKEGI